MVSTKIVEELDHHDKLIELQEQREVCLENKVEISRIMLFRSINKSKRRQEIRLQLVKRLPELLDQESIQERPDIAEEYQDFYSLLDNTLKPWSSAYGNPLLLFICYWRISFYRISSETASVPPL